MKSNFNYVIIIIIGLIIAGASFASSILTENINAGIWLDRGLWIGEIAGIFMLLLNGTFIKTKYFRVIKGIMALIMIGALLKILHWEFQFITGNLILIVGFIGIMTTYFFSFLNKPIKKRLDYLKLAWVITRYTVGVLIFLHIIHRDYQVIASIIMWAAIFDYLIAEKKKGRLFE
ncbi:hypothetical protein [Cellulophaga fucicola]|uniref:Uncharacterized protein n=1 Tax=Cellulophaga fucicola TaxID=76595 RepID=A0A1K1QMS6_9FLAO|nr:hypothetical protein [Cellulophaga fucicola]SFW61255.1 hypothetical protein SAMN05660313_02815 [Cellulophaga fucicola]